MFGKFSLFKAPIKPYTDERGVRVQAELRPVCEVDILYVWTMIRQEEGQLAEETRRLRLLEGEKARREWKSTRLPYVTPCGVFSRRGAKYVERLSGLVVLDIDHLDSQEEACAVRDRLFDDVRLRPLLAFVSPSGRGVKLLVPYVKRASHEVGCPSSVAEFEQSGWQPTEVNLATVSEQILAGMTYLNTLLGSDALHGLTQRQVECDFSGKDVSRACFLCHDPGVRGREFGAKEGYA